MAKEKVLLFFTLHATVHKRATKAAQQVTSKYINWGRFIERHMGIKIRVLHV
jgi:hypothetical protein